MIPVPPAPALRRLAPLPASLAAVLLAGAAAPAAPPQTPSRTGAWTAVGSERVDDRGGWRVPEESPDATNPFLLARTDAQVVVTGPIAHTVLRQEWTNRNTLPVEALYIFPLPDNAAVTGLRLTIGSRRIEAEMRRRDEARATYEKARSQGKVAALLDQERANIFAQRIANIVPGEPIDVTIEFDQELRCDDGDCAYVLPTVVGPRFIPARQADPGRIDPPIAPPGLDTGHRLTFALELDAGMPYGDLRSPTHKMTIEESRSGRAHVRFAFAEARLDRDVEVRFRLGGREPEFGVVAWRGGWNTAESPANDDRTDGAAPERDRMSPGVFSLFLVPPVASEAEAQATPRELTFILDCSGSMKGVPIESAKDVVRRSLRAARPADTLQILRFSNAASGLWSSPVPATRENVERALEYLDTLQGEGGTEMLTGIRAALDRPRDPGRLRLVGLLTDGYIGNENEVLGEVRRILGHARLFALGIGASVNRALLESLAEEGRGAALFLAPREDAEALVERFVKRLGTPVLTDLRLSWEGIDVDDLEPSLPPDLFAGQPLIIHGRYRQPGAGVLVLEGQQRGGRRVVLRRSVTLPAYAADHEALARLWARARIHRLTRESFGNLEPDTIAAITGLGMRFRVMTPYTSLVAVDRVVSHHGGVTQQIDVPVELPFGVDAALFGGGKEAAKSTSAGGNRMAHALAPPSGGSVGRLPGGATGPLSGPPPSYLTAPRGSQPNGAGSGWDISIPDAAREQAQARAAQAQPGVPAQSNAPSTPKADAAAEPDQIPFILVRLVEEDGTYRTIEEDGEAWLTTHKRRMRVQTLDAAELRALRQALADAAADRWPHGDATFARGRSRLVVVLPDATTHSVEIPSGDPTIEAITTILRAATAVPRLTVAP